MLILLLVCKAFAYGLSLSAFRGGPVFPSMFIGAALGIAASGLPGMNFGRGMGIGAMCTAMLRLPLTSTLLAVVRWVSTGVAVTPQVVVAVAVAFVITNVLPGPGPKTPSLPGLCLFRRTICLGRGVAIGDWLPLLPALDRPQ